MDGSRIRTSRLPAGPGGVALSNGCVSGSPYAAGVIGVTASEAWGGPPTSVSNVSVSPLSTASGATTNWTIGFKTSSSGALAYPGASVTVALPTGSSFGSFDGGTLTDTTTGNGLSSDCFNTTGTTVECDFNFGNSANAGDVLSLVLTDVTNPTSTGSASTTVSTECGYPRGVQVGDDHRSEGRLEPVGLPELDRRRSHDQLDDRIYHLFDGGVGLPRARASPSRSRRARALDRSKEGRSPTPRPATGSAAIASARPVRPSSVSSTTATLPTPATFCPWCSPTSPIRRVPALPVRRCPRVRIPKGCPSR